MGRKARVPLPKVSVSFCPQTVDHQLHFKGFEVMFPAISELDPQPHLPVAALGSPPSVLQRFTLQLFGQMEEKGFCQY